MPYIHTYVYHVQMYIHTCTYVHMYILYDFRGMEKMIKSQRESITELTTQISAYQEEVKKVRMCMRALCNVVLVSPVLTLQPHLTHLHLSHLHVCTYVCVHTYVRISKCIYQI